MNNFQLKLVDSSRLIADILVKDIGNDKEKFSEMLEIALLDKYPVSMRAARIIALCIEENPDLITNYFKRIAEALPGIKVDGVKRGFLKMLADTSISFDEESAGFLTDIAFTWLEDSSQAIAIRYYCIEILQKVSLQYPEIGDELTVILKNMPEDISAGLQSKRLAVLNALKKKNGVR
jgi:hypothetical protein